MDSASSSDTASFDMDAAVDQIGDSLFPPQETASETEDATPDADAAPASAGPVGAPGTELTSPAGPVPSQAPKSWPKEMHDHWGKTPKEVQDYWQTREKQMLDGLDQYKTDAQYAKGFKEVIAPFQPILNAQGLTPPQAVNYLLNAHQRLTQGPLESRTAAYQELGRSLGLSQTLPAADSPPIDPTVLRLQQRQEAIEANLLQRAHADFTAAQTRTSKEVDLFASDPAHAHFDEVADDIVLLIKAGLPLQEAYEKAVWANPMTRQKELARIQTEDAAKAKENARLQALPKAKAARANVRSLDSKRTPTEPLGTMEDTLRSTLAEIKARVH